MSSRRIKCFALDIDGTIADYEGHLDLEAAATLRILNDLGYTVVFVSGRSTWELYVLASYLGTAKISVGENGGMVAFSPLDIRLLGDSSHCVMAYEHLSRRLDDVEIKPTMPRFTEVVLKRSFDLDTGQKILEESGMPVNLIDSTFAYHLTNKDVNKGRGLKFALDHLGVEPSEVVAIGDSDTDIPMFKICGSSIVVGNATEGARRNSTYQVDRPMGEGLIDALHLSFQKILGLSLEEVLRS